MEIRTLELERPVNCSQLGIPGDRGKDRRKRRSASLSRLNFANSSHLIGFNFLSATPPPRPFFSNLRRIQTKERTPVIRHLLSFGWHLLILSFSFSFSPTPLADRTTIMACDFLDPRRCALGQSGIKFARHFSIYSSGVEPREDTATLIQ